MNNTLHETTRNRVTQLGLRLTLKLRLTQLDRNNRGETLTNIVTRKVLVLLLQKVVLTRITVNKRRQCGTETFLVSTALMSVDRVRIRVNRLRIRRRPLHRDLNRNLPVSILGLKSDHILMDQLSLLRSVQELDVIK